MSDLARLERMIRRRLDHFIATSGSFLNDGLYVGVDRDGALDRTNDGCCLLGVICLGEPRGPCESHGQGAARILGVEWQTMAYLELGFMHGGVATPATPLGVSLQRLGARLRNDYTVES